MGSDRGHCLVRHTGQPEVVYHMRLLGGVVHVANVRCCVFACKQGMRDAVPQ